MLATLSMSRRYDMTGSEKTLLHLCCQVYLRQAGGSQRPSGRGGKERKPSMFCSSSQQKQMQIDYLNCVLALCLWTPLVLRTAHHTGDCYWWGLVSSSVRHVQTAVNGKQWQLLHVTVVILQAMLHDYTHKCNSCSWFAVAAISTCLETTTCLTALTQAAEGVSALEHLL